MWRFWKGAPELLRSPINYLYADVQLGKGSIDIRRFIAHSDAFLAESQGSIPIHDVFTNSPLNQPIEISLPPDVARRFRIIDDPANPRYKRLPSFAKLTGKMPPEVRPGTHQPAPPNAPTNKPGLDDLLRLIPAKKQ